MGNTIILGVGIKDCAYKDDNGVKLRSYNIWHSMVKNVYGGYKPSRGGRIYDGFTVCDEWLRYSNFNAWYDKQEHGDNTYVLDKDLMPNPTKVFSPDTCCLLPKEIKAFISVKPNKDNGLPIGVHYCEIKEKFVAMGKRDGKVVWLGTHDTPDEAHARYAVNKILYARFLADHYRYVLDERAYKKLMNWKVAP